MRLHLDQKLADEVLHRIVVVWVKTRREQSLISVRKRSNQLALPHPDVPQLGEGVKMAHVVHLPECLDQRFASSFQLLAANGVSLLAGKSFEKQLPFVMVWHDASPDVLMVCSKLARYALLLISLGSNRGIFSVRLSADAVTHPQRAAGPNSWSSSRSLSTFLAMFPLFHLLTNGGEKNLFIIR